MIGEAAVALLALSVSWDGHHHQSVRWPKSGRPDGHFNNTRRWCAALASPDKRCAGSQQAARVSPDATALRKTSDRGGGEEPSGMTCPLR
jgi:hypothetical protein